MEKLKSTIPSNLTRMISQSTVDDLPSTCSSLLDFFLSQHLFHTVVEQLADPQRSLLSKNTQTALDFKQKGNSCFKSGDYAQALNFYTQALRFAPMDYADEAGRNLVSTLFVNRASTLHKMGFLVECIRDCNRAIVVSPSYAKAWYRRGKANASLEMYEDSINDMKVSMSFNLSSSEKIRIQDEVDIMLNQHQKTSNLNIKRKDKQLGSVVEPQIKELECVSTPAKGRGMASTNDISQASLIHSEEPYAAVLSKHYRDTHCHFCLNELPKDTVPCSSCSIPLYCKENCRLQAGGGKSGSNRNNSSIDGNPSDIDLHVSKLSLASNYEIAAADSFGRIPEHRHECGVGHWPAILPSEIVLAGRLFVKLMEQRKLSREANKPTESLELTHNYAQMPLESKLELHIYSIVLIYCLHHTCPNEFPLAGDSASRLVILISQIRVNSMAVVHMKSHELYGSLEHPGTVSPPEDSLTSNIEQVKVGQAIYSTASLFNHSCEPNIHAYFLSRTLFIRTTEFVTAGCPLELSYGPQVGQWGRTERQQMLEDEYRFECQCSGCSGLNFSDLVINAFSCPKPGCFGAILGGEALENHLLPTDKVRREDISKVASLLFEQHKGAFHLDPGHCLSCGSYGDLKFSRLNSQKARSCIKRLQDACLSREIPPNILLDAVQSIHLLRSTLHAYNKDIAQAEDSLAEAFCLSGDFQQAMRHCNASVQILEKLYHPKHIVIGNELVKLASIQLSMGDRISAMHNINRLSEVFALYYGSHAAKIFPYIDNLKKETNNVDEEGHILHSDNYSEG